MINLFTSFYREINTKRNEELITCIKKNIECKLINKIYILNENGDLSTFNSDKLHIISFNNRPKYQDFFDLVNKVTNENDVNIIANTDIYFDDDIEILKYLNLKNKCLALTRWDIKKDRQTKLFFMESSQDSWIFKGKIPKISSDFHIGIPGCDARIAYEIDKADIKISNPALSIKTYHLHMSNFKTHEQENTARIPPPYRDVPHENINNWFVNIYYYFFNKKIYRPYVFNRKKVKRFLLKSYDLSLRSKSYLKYLAKKILIGEENKQQNRLYKLYRKIFWNWLPEYISNPDEIINIYSLSKNAVFFIHIGAHDGITNDPIRQYIIRDSWSGILIEPVKSIFDKLFSNYSSVKNVIFENVGVSNNIGIKDFYYFDIDDEYNQLSTLNENILLSLKWIDYTDIVTKAKYDTINCLSLKQIIEKYNIERLDLLRISTIGSEYEILNSINYSQIKPEVILFENKYLRSNYRNCYKLLKRNDYIVFRSDSNSIAIHNRIATRLFQQLPKYTYSHQ